MKKGVKVSRSGLIMKLKTGFLAPSPDGSVDENTLTEVKCPYSAEDMTPEQVGLAVNPSLQVGRANANAEVEAHP